MTDKTATGSDAVDLDKMRTDFEAWAWGNGYRTERRNDPESLDTYFRHETEQRWIVWQAALITQARAAAPALQHGLTADEMTRLRRMMRAVQVDESKWDDEQCRDAMCTVFGMVAGTLERAALSQQPVQAAGDLHKCIRSLAMLVAEEGIKHGSGSTMAVTSDKVRTVADGVLARDIGRGIVADIVQAATQQAGVEAVPVATVAELHTLRRLIECAEALDKRPRPMCRDCADEDGTCPNSGLDCDMRKLFADAKALHNRFAAPVAQQAVPIPKLDDNEALHKLAYRTLWLAYVWNDHNFKAAHLEARATCEALGIGSFEEANAWIESINSRAGSAASAVDARGARECSMAELLGAPTLYSQVYVAATVFNGWEPKVAREAAKSAAKEYGDAPATSLEALQGVLDEVLRTDGEAMAASPAQPKEGQQ